MDVFEIMRARHSVRSFNDDKIEGDTLAALNELIKECNAEGDLNFQLFLDEPRAFSSFLAHLGKFNNTRNYIALVGKKSDSLREKVGRYGEKIVLKATELGLGTCWVGGTYSKKKCAAVVGKDEKLVCVIAIGYFYVDGTPNKLKPLTDFYTADGDVPEWFLNGVEAARLAPSALNQQKYHFTLSGDKVIASAGKGTYTDLDLSIAKYHFELGANVDEKIWK